MVLFDLYHSVIRFSKVRNMHPVMSTCSGAPFKRSTLNDNLSNSASVRKASYAKEFAPAYSVRKPPELSRVAHLVFVQPRVEKKSETARGAALSSSRMVEEPFSSGPNLPTNTTQIAQATAPNVEFTLFSLLPLGSSVEQLTTNDTAPPP